MINDNELDLVDEMETKQAHNKKHKRDEIIFILIMLGFWLVYLL